MRTLCFLLLLSLWKHPLLSQAQSDSSIDQTLHRKDDIILGSNDLEDAGELDDRSSSEPTALRLVGYYDARAGQRKCHKIFPSSLHIDALTHVNLAHASIDPNTLHLVTVDSQTPASVFQQTPEIRYRRSGNEGLDVFVSIGGPKAEPINGTSVQSVFRSIASSQMKRKRFAKNLSHFLTEYVQRVMASYIHRTSLTYRSGMDTMALIWTGR